MDVDRTRRNQRRRRSEFQRPTADRNHVRLGDVSILGLSGTRLPEFFLSACAVRRSVSQPQQLKKCGDQEIAYVEAQGSTCSHPQSAPCPLALHANRPQIFFRLSTRHIHQVISPLPKRREFNTLGNSSGAIFFGKSPERWSPRNQFPPCVPRPQAKGDPTVSEEGEGWSVVRGSAATKRTLHLKGVNLAMHGHGPHLHYYYYYSDRLLHERIATIICTFGRLRGCHPRSTLRANYTFVLEQEGRNTENSSETPSSSAGLRSWMVGGRGPTLLVLKYHPAPAS